MIIIYILSPKTELTFYIFAIFIGLTWLATVPPTAGIVGKLFGTKYLGTLFGLDTFSSPNWWIFRCIFRWFSNNHLVVIFFGCGT